MSTPALLHSLLAAPGPPGHEEAPAAIWREAAEEFADEVTLDAMGNSVARVNGSGDHPLLAVVGHVDEIALIVSHISEKGFLHVTSHVSDPLPAAAGADATSNAQATAASDFMSADYRASARRREDAEGTARPCPYLAARNSSTIARNSAGFSSLG